MSRAPARGEGAKDPETGHLTGGQHLLFPATDLGQSPARCLRRFAKGPGNTTFRCPEVRGVDCIVLGKVFGPLWRKGGP